MSIRFDLPAALYAGLLFAGYAALWSAKRRSQRRRTEIDPDVFSQRSFGGLQGYISSLSRALRLYVILLVTAHAMAPDNVSGLRQLPLLDRAGVDELGFVVGVAGLMLCWRVQRAMATSWRVGIDETMPTELVTSGPFRLVRNPTYTGLFGLTLGLWLIWPTWPVLSFAMLFIVMLEVQVRCEEAYLLRLHGNAYATYVARTRRYIPGVY